MATSKAIWQLEDLTSPNEARRTPAIVARNIPHVTDANARQNLNIYLRRTETFSHLAGKPFTKLPHPQNRESLPVWHVHIHGGAWRDPLLRSSSIEAHAPIVFAEEKLSIEGIVSIDYTLSPFPSHPSLPYDPVKGDQDDPSRNATHPMHVSDILHAFHFLRSAGLDDDSYMLTGHSAGACLAFQAILLPPQHWSNDVGRPPTPAALIGLNGLYDLPNLVYDLGTSHDHLAGAHWWTASPARLHPKQLQERMQRQEISKVVLIDQSAEDQLVPMNQADKMESVLKQVDGLLVVRGHRCKGAHAAPWEEAHIV
ncbi:hypothetical protein M409DRAFT_71659 [Zasmidium cellare ATCC 36951]|uniref:Arylformamidase n=1 Tax=Zasmidium cellare ATCC 36951 TaxID=1080233 RepID=A0A6A6BUQ8_ZASCE|nr:uncharacterized protein M409DRAFT_71659 [Zasmidium cellare ATCC 36951]KAF2158425.1 hypothetical protein M409DRAFT_71659 [Zasmidium cellare ATCC 36951]